jgi:hypothetical protein
MSDFDISLNSDPEDVLQNPGATTVSDPPLTISGALADYANRAQPPGNSLGLLMDEQQMRDAGIAKDGRVMPASYPAERPPTPGDDKAECRWCGGCRARDRFGPNCIPRSRVRRGSPGRRDWGGAPNDGS